MKICVCLKQVPTRDAPIHINEDSRWVKEQDTRFETNEADQYALEQALRIKDGGNTEVVVVSLGPERVSQSIKEALAKGADRAIHIVAENDFSFDPLQLGSSIAKSIADEHFDIILTGLQSDDMGYGQTCVVIAEQLGLPHATLIVELKITDKTVRARRELEAGWFQWIELPVPCVLSIQSGVDKPRYANMKGILAAKKKIIDKQQISDLGSVIESSQNLQKIYLPKKQKQTEMLQGENDVVAKQLLEKLNLI